MCLFSCSFIVPSRPEVSAIFSLRAMLPWMQVIARLDWRTVSTLCCTVSSCTGRLIQAPSVKCNAFLLKSSCWCSLSLPLAACRPCSGNSSLRGVLWVEQHTLRLKMQRIRNSCAVNVEDLTWKIGWAEWQRVRLVCTVWTGLSRGLVAQKWW